jgi:ABC-type multidrug transport system ATPase subunit
MSTNYAITAENLVKRYAKGKEKIHAVNGLSFQVNQGEVFGLIGPDGAGKTSLIRMLITLLQPESGKAMVQGYDVVKDYKSIRKIVGYMPGRFSLYQDLTVEENLRFFASIFNTTIAENYDLISDIYQQIEPFKKRRAGQLSGGMKQKLALSCALIHKPSVLFLDEPTTGVDAVSRKEFWEMLKRLKAEGITILVSTPYMDEAAQCDRIALMQDGAFMNIAAPAQTAALFGMDLFAVRANRFYELLQNLRNHSLCKNVYPFGQHYHVTAMPGRLHSNDLLLYLQQLGHNDAEVYPATPTVEDVFIYLMNPAA